MSKPAFDEYAEKYDAWFLQNPNVLASEVLLLRTALGEPGRALSVGCGSGLFEMILARDHGVRIVDGLDPSEPMAEIARKRGMDVRIGVAEELPYEDGSFDTVFLNGSPSYTRNLEKAFLEARRILRSGGTIVVLDVPAESSYGLLYRLAAAVGTWEDPRLHGSAPDNPYPVEFAASANWRTTPEKAALLEKVGFTKLEYWQTLTRHPRYSDLAVEEPLEGYDRGDYVAIRAVLQ